MAENASADATVKVLVVDDHPIVREALADMLRDAGYGVVEAGRGDQAVELAASVRPRLVIMDVLMPGMSGIEATERIIDRDPEVRVLMLSVADSAETVRAAVKAGAASYLTKDVASRDSLLDAVRRTAAGERVFAPPELIDALVREPTQSAPTDAARLTLREREIAALVAQGATNSAIASSLALSPRTVENHLARIYRKLGITSRMQLARTAIQQQVDRYPWTGQNCTIMFTDIVAFSAPVRSDHDRAALRTAHYTILRDAFTQAGISWSASYREDRGDGTLIILPPGVPTGALIDRVLPALSDALGRHNGLADASRSMRMRLALDVGPVVADDMGVSGAALIRAARLLEAPAFKEALHVSDADLGAIFSDFVYETTVRRGHSSLSPGEMRGVDIHVKETWTRAWIWFSGHAPATNKTIAASGKKSLPRLPQRGGSAEFRRRDLQRMRTESRERQRTISPSADVATPRELVSMRLPAASAHLSALRTTTASLAARLDFTVEETEELRTAVNEACTMLLAEALPDTDLDCEFELTADAMRISLSARTVDGRELSRDTFAWMVLSTLADDVDTQVDADDRVSIVVRKHRGATSDT